MDEKKISIGMMIVFLLVVNFNLISVFAQISIKPDELPNPTLGEFYEVNLHVQPRLEIDV